MQQSNNLGDRMFKIENAFLFFDENIYKSFTSKPGNESYIYIVKPQRGFPRKQYVQSGQIFEFYIVLHLLNNNSGWPGLKECFNLVVH